MTRSSFSRPNPEATRPHSHQLAQHPSYTHSNLRTTRPERLPFEASHLGCCFFCCTRKVGGWSLCMVAKTDNPILGCVTWVPLSSRLREKKQQLLNNATYFFLGRHIHFSSTRNIDIPHGIFMYTKFPPTLCVQIKTILS